MNAHLSIADLLLVERVKLNGFVASRDKEAFARFCDAFRAHIERDNKAPDCGPTDATPSQEEEMR